MVPQSSLLAHITCLFVHHRPRHRPRQQLEPCDQRLGRIPLQQYHSRLSLPTSAVILLAAMMKMMATMRIPDLQRSRNLSWRKGPRDGSAFSATHGRLSLVVRTSSDTGSRGRAKGHKVLTTFTSVFRVAKASGGLMLYLGMSGAKDT